MNWNYMVLLEQNAAGREDVIEDLPADFGMGLVRRYCFAVTEYLYALMGPYRIDGPVWSGPIILSHHSLEYSRQTGNTIMGVCHKPRPNSEFKFVTPGQHAMFHKHGQPVIPVPRAYTPPVVDYGINQGKCFFSPGITSQAGFTHSQYNMTHVMCCSTIPGVAPTPGAYLLESAFFVSICKDLTSRWPKLWDLTERGHLSYTNSTGAGHQIPVSRVAIDYFAPYQRELNIRYNDVHTRIIALFGFRVITCACGVFIPVTTKFVAVNQSGPRRYVHGPKGPGHIPAYNLKERSWGMDQCDDQSSHYTVRGTGTDTFLTIVPHCSTAQLANLRSWMFCWMWDKPVQCFEIFTPSRISSIRFYPTFPLTFWAHVSNCSVQASVITSRREFVSRVAYGVTSTPPLPRNGLGHVRVTSQLEESSPGVANRRSCATNNIRHLPRPKLRAELNESE
ncbi:hypothetical protein H4582DRAFT_2063340 [Lactarius indigo]|nr:hypothetical protein H4582DRAFT_2063340 [Lactarius indigo]